MRPITLLKSKWIIFKANKLRKNFQKESESNITALERDLKRIGILLAKWPENPIKEKLIHAAGHLHLMGMRTFAKRYPIKRVSEAEYDRKATLECPLCGWKGLPATARPRSGFYDDLLDLACPTCGLMLVVVAHPTLRN